MMARDIRAVDASTQPHVVVRTEDGRSTPLRAGDLVGRVSTAALLLDDPRVSEAHALMTIRRGCFVLLALRRLLEVDGRPLREVELRVGTRVGLSERTSLTVETLFMPRSVLAVEAPGLGVRRLGPVASLRGGTPPAVWARFEPQADAHVWSLAGGWRLQRPEAGPEALAAGQTVTLAGTDFTFVEVPGSLTGVASTQGPTGRLAPLRLVTHYDGVELHRPGVPVMTFGGLGARILAELAAFGGPIPWSIVAREIWNDAPQVPEKDLRHRWDAALSRLRRKLDEAGVRTDLVRADRNGCFQLVLNPGDELEDRA